MDNEDKNDLTWEISSTDLDLAELGVEVPDSGPKPESSADKKAGKPSPSSDEAQPEQPTVPLPPETEARVATRSMGTIEYLAPGIAREINTPIQYVGDNVRFLQDAFKDLETLMERYQDLLEATRSAQVAEAEVKRVDEALNQADWDYLSDEVPHAIDQTLDGVEQVCKIVRALTDFFNPSKDEVVSLDLNQAIESAVVVLQSEWRFVADVVMDFDTYLPCVNCAPDDINQVVLHLVINATRSLEEKLGEEPVDKGEIHISTREDGRWVEIRFRDNGGGIPIEIQTGLLNPLESAEASGDMKGLDLCRSLVEGKYGGSIQFETDPTKGTTFIIRMRHK
jgi:signal transduction histidine kinase